MIMKSYKVFDCYDPYISVKRKWHSAVVKLYLLGDAQK
jgi:hypothetical protein